MPDDVLSTVVKVSLVVDTVGNSESKVVVGNRVVISFEGWVVFFVVIFNVNDLRLIWSARSLRKRRRKI